MPINLDNYRLLNNGVNAPEKMGVNRDPKYPQNPAFQSNSKVGSRFRVEEGTAQYTWRSGGKAGLDEQDIQKMPIVGWRGEYNRNNIAQIFTEPGSVRQDTANIIPRNPVVKSRYISSNASNGAKTKNNWVIYVKLAIWYRNRWAVKKIKYPEAISDPILQSMFHARDEEGNDLPVAPHHYMMYNDPQTANEFHMAMANFPAVNGLKPGNLFDMSNPVIPAIGMNYRSSMESIWESMYDDVNNIPHLPPDGRTKHYWPFRYSDNSGANFQRCSAGVDWNEWSTIYKPVGGFVPPPDNGNGGAPGPGPGPGGPGAGGPGVGGQDDDDDALNQFMDYYGMDDNDNNDDGSGATGGNSSAVTTVVARKSPPRSQAIVAVPIPQTIVTTVARKRPAPVQLTRQEKENADMLADIIQFLGELENSINAMNPPRPDLRMALNDFENAAREQITDAAAFNRYLLNLAERLRRFAVQNLPIQTSASDADMAPLDVSSVANPSQLIVSSSVVKRISPVKVNPPPKLITPPKVTKSVSTPSSSSSGHSFSTISPVSPVNIPELTPQVFFFGKNKPKDTAAATREYFEGLLNKPAPKKKSPVKNTSNPLSNLQSLRKTKNKTVFLTPDSSESSGSSKKRKSSIDNFYQPFLTPTPPRTPQSTSSSVASSNKRTKLSFTPETDDFIPGSSNVSEYSGSPMLPETLRFLQEQDSVASRVRSNNNVRPAPINYSPGVRVTKPRAQSKKAIETRPKNRFPLRKAIQDPMTSRPQNVPTVDSPVVRTRVGRTVKKKKLSPFKY